MKYGFLLKSLLVLEVVFVFCSCKRDVDVDVPAYCVDVEQRDSVHHFFSGYSYVMLETDERCFLGDVDKIEVDSAKIAILDKARILFFERNTGRFMGKIDRLGKGDGEYLSIDDFKVRDSLVYVLSGMQKELLVYDIGGRQRRKIHLNDFYRHFEFVDGHRVFLSSDFGNDTYWNFVLFDLETETIIGKFDEFSRNESVFFNSFCPFSGKSGDGFYVIHPFDYTVYALTERNFSPYCEFDFNTEEHFDVGIPFVELADQTRNRTVVKYLGRFIQDDDALYLTFELFDSHGIGTYLYKRKGQQDYLMRIGEDFLSDFPYLSRPEGIYGKTFISTLPALSVLNIEDMYGLSLFGKKGLDKEDNHVVFFHNLN